MCDAVSARASAGLRIHFVSGLLVSMVRLENLLVAVSPLLDRRKERLGTALKTLGSHLGHWAAMDCHAPTSARIGPKKDSAHSNLCAHILDAPHAEKSKQAPCRMGVAGVSNA